MSSPNILRSAAGLTLSGILAKTIDFVFRAYYSRQLGSEGMGIFSLVFSFHGLMLTVATGGLGVAVSKAVSEQYALHKEENIRKIMKISLLWVLFLSAGVILLSVVFSKQIAIDFLKEARCQRSIIFLLPSILFMGVSYCIKGYFYASRKVLIPASSEFLEQAVKITTITFFLKEWLPSGVENGCAGVFLGISIGEFSSCLYLFLFYLQRSKGSGGELTKDKVAPSLFKVALPVMATSLAGSFLRMKEEVLIVSGLRSFGLSQSEALGEYGVVKGMVMPLIVFPLTLLSSCFTLLVPEISRAGGMKNLLRLRTLVGRIYRFTVLGGVFVGMILVGFSGEVAELTYGAPHIGEMLKLFALLAPVMFLDSVSCGVLNGLGRQNSLLVYSLSDSALRILLIWVLVPKVGGSALFVIIALSNLFTASLTVSEATRRSGLRLGSGIRTILHLFSAGLSLGAVSFVGRIFPIPQGQAGMVFGMALAGTFYIIFCLVFYRAMGRDLRWLLGRMFI